MFCGKCGAKNEDNAEVCSNCGAQLKVNKSTQISLSLPEQNERNKRMGIIAVVIVAIAAILISVFLFGGGYKSTIKKYVNASFEGDAKSLLKLIPKKMVGYVLEEAKQEGYYLSDTEDLIPYLNEELREQLDYLDSYFGEGWKYSYEITEEEDVKDTDLEDIKVEYKKLGIKVSDAKSVDVEITATSDETEASNSLYIDLIKVGHSWYVDALSMGGLL